MKTHIFIINIIFLLLLTSCNKYYHNYIYSPDRKQCITIISDKKIRYIIAGKHPSVPETNFLKLDISKRYSFADHIVGSWRTNKYNWQIINAESIILENKLDTMKYKFTKNYPTNSLGISTKASFSNEKGFFYLGFDYGEIYDSSGVILD